jgi:hypothetical protein
MLTRTSRLWALTAVAGFQLALSGCAQDVGDLDRTQPNRIDVSVFKDGKPWWFLQTVVGIPPASTFTFVGESSLPPERIVWDVQENWLIAYRAYEWIVGSQVPYSATDHNNVIGGSNSPYFGTPVAAYAILSHFDIQREYNPQTGEQTNVISENTTDRPWYLRQYVRVDWSNNALGAFNFMSIGGGGLNNGSTTTTISPLAYFPDQEDPTNPDRTEVSSDYIGVVNKISYTAMTDNGASQYYGYPVYTCFLWPEAFGIGDCGPGEVKIRLSFRKVPDDHDFVPRTYTDQDVLKFGVWQQQHAVWDPERGFLEADLSQQSNAVMHHIWQADHLATDPKTNLACDKNDFTNQNCIAPLNQRTPKPIVYYTSDSWPAYNDVRHSKMWLHAALLANDYDDDMRGVVAAALRGGPKSVETWAAAQNPAIPMATGVEKIDYTKAPTDYQNRYGMANGLDYLAYPPDIRHLDTNNYGMEGVRPNATYITTDGSKQLCTASQVTAGQCQMCDPKTQYCMGIGQVPLSVIPRMFVMCHNPVQPRKPAGVTDPSGNAIDKSDINNPSSFDFSIPGDPDICDPRPDSDRINHPLNPQMGDLRYHMLAWVDEPDQASPGGIGEPAWDPVTGEIVTSHGYIYSRAIELNATQSADLIAVMNGWETYNDVISGAMVRDYVNAQASKPPQQFSAHRLNQMLTSPMAQQRIAMVRQQVLSGQRDPGGASDWRINNWQQMQNMIVPELGINFQAPPPGAGEWAKDFAPQYGPNANGQGLPAPIQQQLSMANLLAPQPVSNWNSQYVNRDRIFADHHVLTEDEVAPVATRLAKYYKDKFALNDPCSGTYTAMSSDYKTCIWETARQEIVGNMWRSYSNHEVGHTFGQFHNFAGSTDALNYFDPYWSLRQQNTMTVKEPSSPTDPTCFYNQPDPMHPGFAINSNCFQMYVALGKVPGDVALAPEWLQAPSQQSLDQGLREYQYTSIMDYNANFNSDFQGLGKYDHACHMYQYANQVEVFDPAVLTNVPANKDIGTDPNYAELYGQQLYPHETDDTLRIPFNVHYTMYPWIINDGLKGDYSNATPLPQAIERMMHARKWVNASDLLGKAPNPNDTSSVADRNNSVDLTNAVQVPYRFCSDYYNQGESHCQWFDSGADQYEQANGFIQDYNVNFMFRAFKRGVVNVDLGDYVGAYMNRMWQRTFQPLTRIGQHFLNEEFIARPNTELCPVDAPLPTEAIQLGYRGGLQHVVSPLCGLSAMAGTIMVEDFLVKILQTPNTDSYVWDSTNNIYISGTLGNAGTPPSGAPTQLDFQAGDSSKFDQSQFNQQQLGQPFLWKPTVLGYWVDKWIAAQAMGNYDTYFVGSLNNQPLNYLISANDFFFKDNQRAISAWVLDDPKVAPQVAVWASGTPNDPQSYMGHPPVSVYQNSDALAQSANTFSGNINPWCPDMAAWCAQTASTAAQYSPLGYKLLSYTDIYGKQQPVRVDPNAVYFEKLIGLGAALINFGNYDQRWIQTIRVGKVGDHNISNPAALGCETPPNPLLGTPAKPTKDIPTADTGLSCEDGTPCNALDLSGANCTNDGSYCIHRNYKCPGNEIVTGNCIGTNGQVPDGFDPTTCDPKTFAYFSDGLNVYWATKYVPQFGDLTDTDLTVDPAKVYSANYEAVKLAAKQAAGAPSGQGGLNARNFLDIFRAYYYWYQYGTIPTQPSLP